MALHGHNSFAHLGPRRKAAPKAKAGKQRPKAMTRRTARKGK